MQFLPLEYHTGLTDSSDSISGVTLSVLKCPWLVYMICLTCCFYILSVLVIYSIAFCIFELKCFNCFIYFAFLFFSFFHRCIIKPGYSPVENGNVEVMNTAK